MITFLEIVLTGPPGSIDSLTTSLPRHPVATFPRYSHGGPIFCRGKSKARLQSSPQSGQRSPRMLRMRGLRCHHILKFYSFQFMGEYVRCFLQLSARNIHLLSQYPAAGKGFDNIYKALHDQPFVVQSKTYVNIILGLSY